MSGTQFNYSQGAPENGLELDDYGIERKKNFLPTSKTFRNWVFNPWIWNSIDGRNLNRVESIAVTFVKSTDPNTGIEIVFATLLLKQFDFP